MRITVLEEVGHEIALKGLALSYKDSAESDVDWWTPVKYAKIRKVAKVLSKKGGGHSKFLESVVVYLDINAPRYWWSEFDTYRIGVTKNSESTMHKLSKRLLTQDDFATPIPNCMLISINDAIHAKLPVEQIKGLLPESFMQRRIVCTNYKTLQGMCWQRETHKLPEWNYFIYRLKQSLLHYEDYIE